MKGLLEGDVPIVVHINLPGFKVRVEHDASTSREASSFVVEMPFTNKVSWVPLSAREAVSQLFY